MTTTSTTPAAVNGTIADALHLQDAADVEFAHLDPRTLIIETNVRDDDSVDLDPGFIASIRQYGVIQPILVIRTSAGEYKVRAGKRRTLGSIAADRPTIPARILNEGPGVERLIHQIIENDQRKDFTESERVAGYEQMALEFGLSAGQIAGRLGRTKREVTTALRVAKSAPARQAVAAGLTIDQAATIAAFDGHPDVVARLTDIALTAPEDLAHEAQAERDDLATARERARMIENLTATGITVLDNAPTYTDPQVRDLSRLRQDDGCTPMRPADHADCPGHAAYVGTRGYSDYPVTYYVCTDFPAHGHHVPSYDQPTTARTGGMTDEQKAERRRVIDGNKAWKSATTVRRDWLRTLAARTTAPKGASALLGYLVTHRGDDLVNAARDGHQMARDLLGITANMFNGRQSISDAIDAAPPGRQNIIVLTLALAAVEDRTDTQTWRTPAAHVARYLSALSEWGYTLSAIERQTITGKPDPDDDPDDAQDVTDTTPDADSTDQPDEEPTTEPTPTTPEPDEQHEPDEDGQTDPLDLSEYDAA